MKILERTERFRIQITKEIIGLDFMKVGEVYTVIATFIGRNNRECIVTEPDLVNDRNIGSHWIHIDNYKRV